MDYASLKSIAATQDWLLLWPELSMALVALLILLGDSLAPARFHDCWRRVGAAFTFFILAGMIAFANCSPGSCQVPASAFGGMIEVHPSGQWFRMFFLLTNLVVFWLGGHYFLKRGLVRTEYFALSMLVTAAMMLLAHARHFAVVFVSLETIAIGLYVLVAYDRKSAFSLEAGIKYLVVGGTNTAILLLGIALLYGMGGHPDLEGRSADPLLFSNLHAFLSLNGSDAIAQAAVLLILASAAFKVGLVPFQIWIPDVYQGAPTPTTYLLAVSSKTAGMVLLFLLFGSDAPFTPLAGFLSPVLTFVVIASLLYGNLTALGYTNVKRLIGMSGVSHAAFLLLGVLVWLQPNGVAWIQGALLFYLFGYFIASTLVFGVMAILGAEHDEAQDLYDYSRLSEQRPLLAGVLTIGLASLAGIPPLVGFVAKFSIFVAAWQSSFFVILGFAVLGVVLSIYYYFKWIREAYYHDAAVDLQLEEGSVSRPVFAGASFLDAFILGLFAAAACLLGLLPLDLLSNWSFL
jgi:NADH-quinone oxidoreductase subunit N